MKSSWIERVLALALLALSWPVFLVISIVVYFSSGAPVIFRAERVGKDGELFTMFKFRTMTQGAVGNPVTVEGDARVTSFGRVLRRTKLDELPQLINVAKGEMRFVGPRPESPQLLASDEVFQELSKYLPGITSAASVRYRNEEGVLRAMLNDGMSLDEAYSAIAQRKAQLDLDYVRSRSWKTDARLVTATVRTMLPRSAATDSPHPDD